MLPGKTPTHNYTPHRVVPHPHASSYYVIHILPLTVLILVFLSLSLLLLCNCTTVGKMVRVMWKAREKRRRKSMEKEYDNDLRLMEDGAYDHTDKSVYPTPYYALPSTNPSATPTLCPPPLTTNTSSPYSSYYTTSSTTPPRKTSPSASLPTSPSSPKHDNFTIPYSALTIKKLIGGGGFGQVWEGTFHSTPVAVKILTNPCQTEKIGKDVIEEFKAEVVILSNLRHPNICLFMGADFDPPNRCIVTELATRGSLWDALGAARGMAYLHGSNPPILHRDLKSANLLLDEGYNVKICDFGLSRLKEFTNSHTGQTGTTQWMAREVLNNEKYGFEADVYSFGVIMWEVITRECPFEGMNQIQVAMRVLNEGRTVEVPEWCRMGSPRVAGIVEGCLENDPRKRPSFEEILRVLEDV